MKIEILSKNTIKRIIKKEINKSLKDIYKDLNNLRKKMILIEDEVNLL